MSEHVSLFDRIKLLAEHLPVSHVFDNTEKGKITAAIVHFLEHGEEILEAAEKDAQWLIDQLSGPREQRGPGSEVPAILTKNDPAPEVNTGATGPDVAALQRQIDELTAREAARQQSADVAASVAGTTVTTEPVTEQGDVSQPDPVPVTPPSEGASS